MSSASFGHILWFYSIFKVDFYNLQHAFRGLVLDFRQIFWNFDFTGNAFTGVTLYWIKKTQLRLSDVYEYKSVLHYSRFQDNTFF